MSNKNLENSYKKVFVSGSAWTTAQQVIFTVLGFVQLMITSRLLTPSDFGVYAIALFFSNIGRVAFSMGFSGALIQKQGDIRSYLNTTWTASICVAGVASVIVSICIPAICTYYFNNTDAIFPSIFLVFAGIFAPASSPHMIFYLKDVKLKKYFFLNIIPKIISFLLVVVLVYTVKSYWGLVIALASESFFYFLISWIITKGGVKFSLDWQKFKELYNFGMWMQLKNILSWASSNLDVAVVGNVLGSNRLGLYNRSQSISSYPRNFIDSIINMVAFPLYSKIIKDRDYLNYVFNKIQSLTLLLLAVVVLIFWLYGEQIVLFVLGTQWVEMSLSFKILSTAYIAQGFLFSFNPLLRSYGFTKCEFITFATQITFMVLLLYPLTRYFNLNGAGYAVLTSVIVTFPIVFYFIKKYTCVNLRTSIISLSLVVIMVFGLYHILHWVDTISPAVWILKLIRSCILFFITMGLIFKITKLGPGRVVIEDFVPFIKKKICSKYSI